MQFNKLSAQAKFDGNNFFYANLSQARQTMFKRAFGILQERHPIVRKARVWTAGAKKHSSGDAVMNYQESLVDARQYVEEVIEVFASLMGVEKSQAVHAVVSGNLEAFTRIILRRIQQNTATEFVMETDPKTGEPMRKKITVLKLPHGHRWKGNPASIDEADVAKMIRECWIAAGGTLTEHEQALEGGEGAIVALKVKENAKRRKVHVSRRGDDTKKASAENISKGAKELNAKQAARNDAIAGNTNG